MKLKGELPDWGVNGASLIVVWVLLILLCLAVKLYMRSSEAAAGRMCVTFSFQFDAFVGIVLVFFGPLYTVL